jgi:hypothetical protein
MKSIFLNNLGDLAEIQRASFFRFLSLGISEELENFVNPIECRIFLPTRKREDRNLCKLFFYPNEQRYVGPRMSLDMAYRSEGTYSLELYVQGYYSYLYDPKYDFGIKESESKKQKKKEKKLLLKKKQNS